MPDRRVINIYRGILLCRLKAENSEPHEEGPAIYLDVVNGDINLMTKYTIYPVSYLGEKGP